MHGERNCQLNHLCSPDDSDGERLADALAYQAVKKIIHLTNWRFALLRCAGRLYGDQQQPSLLAQIFSQGVEKAGRLGTHAQIGTADAPMLQQFPTTQIRVGAAR